VGQGCEVRGHQAGIGCVTRRPIFHSSRSANPTRHEISGLRVRWASCTASIGGLRSPEWVRLGRADRLPGARMRGRCSPVSGPHGRVGSGQPYNPFATHWRPTAGLRLRPCLSRGGVFFLRVWLCGSIVTNHSGPRAPGAGLINRQAFLHLISPRGRRSYPLTRPAQCGPSFSRGRSNLLPGCASNTPFNRFCIAGNGVERSPCLPTSGLHKLCPLLEVRGP
jgi:hypothetical protein